MRVSLLPALAACFLLATTLAPRLASAQEWEDKGDGPRPSTGFQLALRTGLSLPMGSTTGASGDSLGRTFGHQYPLLVDIGAKPTEALFLGAYLGFAVGAAGDEAANFCGTGRSCTSSSLRIGVQAHYHLRPINKIDPFVGLGVGWEAAHATAGPAEVTVSGPELANLLFGLDVRINRVFGVGPFVNVGIGEYTSATAKAGGVDTSQDITKHALHEWVTFGARFVFFP